MKIDKGFVWSYWKLSYRRKFIRTLWMIPFVLLAIVNISFNHEFTTFIKAFLILILLISEVIQLIYNYRHYQKEKIKQQTL